MGSQVLPQAAISELLSNGGYDAHLRRLRRELAAQVQNIRRVVLRKFPPGTTVTEPEGGYVLWVTMPEGSLNVRELFLNARAEGSASRRDISLPPTAATTAASGSTQGSAVIRTWRMRSPAGSVVPGIITHRITRLTVLFLQQ